MKLKVLLTALLVSAVAAAAPIVGSKPPAEKQSKNPLDREWLILATAESGFTIAIDPKSFKVIKPGDEFSFDTLMIFGKDNFVNPPGLPPVSAHMTTMKASCSKKHAQIIADTLHDETGRVVATNEATKLDKMGPYEPTSPAGKVIESVCAGKSIIQPPKKKEYQRGDSIKSA